MGPKYNGGINVKANDKSSSISRTQQKPPLTKLQQLQQLQQRKRRIASIFQHYYPEGGWGLVVLGCGAVAQALAQGAVMAPGGVPSTAATARVEGNYADAGRKKIFDVCVKVVAVAVALQITRLLLLMVP